MASTPLHVNEEFSQEDEALLLQELKEISNKRSAKRNAEASNNKTVIEGKHDTCSSSSASFLNETPEVQGLNQYWYSQGTINTFHDAIKEAADGIKGGFQKARVAFLSTPSLYFAFEATDRANFHLFDFDKSAAWASDEHYVFYDYNEPLQIDSGYLKTFDMLVVDPPFITREVWEKYSQTAEALLKSTTSSLILCTTVQENALLMKELFNANETKFQPSIPNLVYQYSTFANFSSNFLSKPNEEIGS